MPARRWSSIGKALIEDFLAGNQVRFLFVLGFLVTFSRQQNQMAVNSPKKCVIDFISGAFDEG
jgi:hypothetical protein